MCLLSFDYPPRSGGVARLCADAHAALAGAGYRVEVITQREGERRSNATVSRVSRRRPLREASALAALRRLPKGTRVLASYWYPEGVLAMAAGVPFSVLAHGAELLPVEPWRRDAWEALQRQVLERADVVIANSRYTAELVERRAPGARVRVVWPGVDVARFRPQPRPRSREDLALLTVARLDRHKGHRTVFRALTQLSRRERARMRYRIAGTGACEIALRSSVQELGLEDCVTFLGFVPEPALPALYARSDVFLLCSEDRPGDRAVEGFGIALLEAQASGRPVIACESGGMPDAVSHGDGGWLIHANDAARLADLLRTLLSRPDLRAQRAIEARARIEAGFTMAHFGERLVSAWEVRR